MASDKSETSSPSAEQMDHPYVTLLHKRIRSHRKKLEKIRALELKDPKQLNTQQLELVGTKPAMEKLLVELETLREQFIQLEEQEQQARDQAKHEEIQRLKDELEKATEQKREPFRDVQELLKALHVVNLHQALGKDVPMVLDFFEKVLRGNTRPPAELSYEENLAESMDEAKKYLTGSDKVFACDTTYVGLRAFVEELASGKNEEEEAEQEETPEIPATELQINFFTESQLEQDEVSPVVDEQAEEAGEPVEMEEPVVDVEVQESIQVAPEEDVTVTEEQVEVAVEAAPAPEAIPSPPLSFAAVAAAGVSAERTPSPPASASSEAVQQKKEAGSEGNSPRGKNNQRRRGQGRWREKGSNSGSGNKAGNGSPTNAGKPRRPRGPRPNAENADAQGGKTKEGRRPRVDRALRKQGNNAQQHAAPMIAPHA